MIQCTFIFYENNIKFFAKGGGPPPKPLSPLAETVGMVIRERNSIIDSVHGGIDYSLIQLVTEDSRWSV